MKKNEKEKPADAEQPHPADEPSLEDLLDAYQEMCPGDDDPADERPS